MGIFSDIAGPIANKFEGDLSWKRQRQMYQHRYQWQVADMRKAGINPIMMSTKGAGNTGSVPAPKMDIKGIGADASNVMQARRQKQELAQIKSQEDLNRLLGAKATADAATSAASARNLNAQALLTELGIPAATNAAQLQIDFPHIQRAEWLMRNLGSVVSGGLAGFITGRFTGKRKAPNKPGRNPEYGSGLDRNRGSGSRPWRSAAPGAK